MIILAGSSNLPLAQSIAHHLGLTLTASHISHFSNQELRFTLPCSVRGHSVFLIQSGYCAAAPAVGPDELLMELCMMIRACREASAERITCVIPCFPYSLDKDDIDAVEAEVEVDRSAGYKVDNDTTSVSSTCYATATSTTQYNPFATNYRKWKAKPGKLVANLLQIAGAHQILSLSLHHPQFPGFFDIPVDNLQCTQLILDTFATWKANKTHCESLVLMSPDVGGSKRVLDLSGRLGVPFVALSPISLLGSLPQSGNFSVFLVDDLMDTGKKLNWALNYLISSSSISSSSISSISSCISQYPIQSSGPSLKSIGIFLTHALFSGSESSSHSAYSLLQKSALQASSVGIRVHLFVTDSVQQDQQKLRELRGVEVEIVGVGPLLANTLDRLQRGQSISSMW
jgi:ribose-phosphate pyrophosphokinase